MADKRVGNRMACPNGHLIQFSTRIVNKCPSCGNTDGLKWLYVSRTPEDGLVQEETFGYCIDTDVTPPPTAPVMDSADQQATASPAGTDASAVDQTSTVDGPKNADTTPASTADSTTTKK